MSLEDIDYGGIDITVPPRAPYHMVEREDGRVLLLDRNNNNCVNGRKGGDQSFPDKDLCLRWCEIRRLKVETRSVYSD
jgi:hypothetical protein